MRSLLDRVAKFFGWLDTLEFIVPAMLAALWLIAGPLLAIFFFSTTIISSRLPRAPVYGFSLALLACAICAGRISAGRVDP